MICTIKFVIQRLRNEFAEIRPKVSVSIHEVFKKNQVKCSDDSSEASPTFGDKNANLNHHRYSFL